MGKLAHLLDNEDKKGIKKIIYNLQSFWYDSWIRKIYYNIQYGIENIIIWLPIIWRDRQWDYHYLYEILAKKFELMEKLHRYYGHAVISPKIAKQLMIVKNLSKRLSESHYLQNATIEYDKKYNDDFRFDFEPCKDRPGFYTLVDHRTERQREDFLWASKHSKYMEQQDLDMLFKLIHKHVKGWWD